MPFTRTGAGVDLVFQREAAPSIVSSQASTTSTIRQKQAADIEFREKKALLSQKTRQLTTSLVFAEEDLVSLNAVQDDSPQQEQLKKQIRRQIQELRDQLQAVAEDEAILNDKHALTIGKIEDEEKQSSSFGSRSSRVKTWVEESAVHNPSDLIDDDATTQDTEAYEKERLLSCQGGRSEPNNDVHGATPSENPSKAIPSSPQKSVTCIKESNCETNMAATLLQVSEAMQAIAKMNVSNKNSTTEKFLTRQAIKIELPHFYGRPEEWPSFISEYQRTTETCQLTSDENLQRLRKSLKGEALKAVQCLLISPDNVHSVIDTLKMRFGDSTHIINAMIQKVRNACPVKEGRLQTFIDFGTLVNNLCSTIETLKEEHHLQNTLLLQEFVEKLSESYKIRWTTQAYLHWKVENPDLNVFRDWLQLEMKVACKIVPPLLQEDKPKEKTYEDKKLDRPWKKSVHATTKTFNMCLFCDKEGHSTCDCRDLKNKSPDDRVRLALEKKICISCLKSGCIMRTCKEKKKCSEKGCNHSHHRIFHGCRSFAEIFQKKFPDPKAEVFVPQQAQSYAINFNRLRYVPIEVSGPKSSEVAIAMLDDGSDVTIMDEALSQRIGLAGPATSLEMTTMNGDGGPERSRMVSVTVTPVGKKDKYTLNGVYTLSTIKLKAVGQDVDSLKRSFKHLRNIPLESFALQKPKMLIGSCHWSMITHQRTVDGGAGDPIAVKSKLGWSVISPQRNGVWSADDPRSCYHIDGGQEHEARDEVLNQLVKASFTTEDFGVKILQEKPRSKADKKALQLMEDNIRRAEDGKRWELPLLWKTDEATLPESKSQALQRLRCQEKKMDKDEDLANQMCGRLQDYEQAGFIRKLTPEELAVTHPKEWYLPVFGVKHPNKTKIRLVFDAAAKSHGTSLNDKLCQGPDLNNPLPAVLMRFRLYDYAYVGDIKDMFHRVFIKEEDRHSQRFFWRGKERSRDPDIYQMNVMIFGAASSPVCAQFVKNHNAKLFEKEFPVAARAIQKEFYVDDFLHSSPSIEEAQKMIKDIIHIQDSGGFCMCGWSSNSKDILKTIPKDLLAKEFAGLEIDKSPLPDGRVLGMKWDPNEDKFSFNLNFSKVRPEIVNGTARPTKREVLVVIASVFDPLGLLGHVIVRGKILLQEIWRSGLGWDDPLTDTLDAKWKMWLAVLQEVKDLKVSRVYSPKLQEAKSKELHVFVDGSEKAFSATAYFRVEYDDHVDVSLIMSKNRVTPLKSLSIPKIELQAAVMGIRLANTIKAELGIDIDRTVYWSDSATCIKWIKGDPRNYKQFVSHRVGEILESSDPSDWRWIPTKLNVADDATRDTYPIDVTAASRYLCGENFLKLEESQWPQEQVPPPDENAMESESKKNVTVTSLNLFKPDALRYSKFEKAVRVVAWIRRFFRNRKNKIIKTVPEEGTLKVDELEEAEMVWLKMMQKDSFPEDLKSLEEGIQNNVKKDFRKSRLRKLDPILVDGLLRVNGRIGKAKHLPLVTNQPIILDDKHPFVKLLLDYYHRKCGHQGVQTVANELRQRFWILNRTSAVKKSFRDCQFCKVGKAKPEVPKMGDLPAARLEAFVHPFSHCGMDNFGPVYVTVGRRVEKRWGVIFTCMSTRAVHLELAASLSTDSAINAIRRFGNRRGYPTHLYSDNGRNFVGADIELQKALGTFDHAQFESRLASNGIRWQFMPPASPHMGGSWERLVGVTKQVLWKLLKEATYPEETLFTFLTEVENILNSRPLLENSSDPEDDEVLTPNHFLLGWTNGCSKTKPIRDPEFGEFEDWHLRLKKSWKAAQRLADQFWTLWIKAYLPTLVKRSKWQAEGKNVKIGDIVIVVDDQNPRSKWNKGVIESVFPGKDGRVRSVDVRTIKGLYRRPVVKICVLDVHKKEINKDDFPLSQSSRGE